MHGIGVDGAVLLLCRPDPELSANIYCRGAIDSALANVVQPLVTELPSLNPSAGVWTMRYARCGEHLKLRLHVPPEHAALVVERVEELAGRWLASLDPHPNAEERAVRTEMPAVDVEDDRGVLYPDRTMLWTTYRRSPVSFGGATLVNDDRYAALMTAWFATACATVVGGLRPGPDGSFDQRSRQNLVLRNAIGALTALGWPAARCTSYLRYHRDWLVRFSAGADLAEEQRLYTLLAEQAVGLSSSVATLAEVAQNVDPESVRRSHGGLVALVEHASVLCEGTDATLDPWAPEPVFPVLFKALHGFANQSGTKLLVEAFAYELLLRALGADHD
jgi:hypothetical protein